MVNSARFGTLLAETLRAELSRLVRRGPPGGMSRETWFRLIAGRARCSPNTLWRWRIGDRVPSWKRPVALRVLDAERWLRADVLASSKES